MAKQLPDAETYLRLGDRLLRGEEKCRIPKAAANQFMVYPYASLHESCVGVERLPKDLWVGKGARILTMSANELGHYCIVAWLANHTFVVYYNGEQWELKGIPKDRPNVIYARVVGFKNYVPVIIFHEASVKPEERGFIFVGDYEHLRGELNFECCALTPGGGLVYQARPARSNYYTCLEVEGGRYDNYSYYRLQDITITEDGTPWGLEIREEEKSFVMDLITGQYLLAPKGVNKLITHQGALRLLSKDNKAYLLKRRSFVQDHKFSIKAGKDKYKRWLGEEDNSQRCVIEWPRDYLECWTLDGKAMPAFRMVSPVYKANGGLRYWGYADDRHVYEMELS
jgi:hypothetical protein